MFRVGLGHDRHRLAAGRPLIIGGLPVPHEKGAVAHSDGDVLLHAITDALLGATGRGDIGEWFPDTDPALAGADSSELLAKVVAETLGGKFGSSIATAISSSTQRASKTRSTTSDANAAENGTPVSRDRM